MKFQMKGHGNGKENHRTWVMKINVDVCKVDGHEWHTYKMDPTQEFCSMCGKFRNKEEVK